MTQQCVGNVGSAIRTCPFPMEDGPFVYFFQAGNRIKIGHARDLERRFRDIQTGSPDPLTTLGAARGEQKLERAIHKILRGYRVHGEWFQDCSVVRAMLARIIAGAGDEIIAEAKTHKDPRAIWASAALKQIAEPLLRDESIHEIIRRAAAKMDWPFWRTFDVWYGKAKRLRAEEIRELETALDRCAP